MHVGTGGVGAGGVGAGGVGAGGVGAGAVGAGGVGPGGVDPLPTVIWTLNTRIKDSSSIQVFLLLNPPTISSWVPDPKAPV